MKLSQARMLADAANAAYEKDPLKSGLIEASNIDTFGKIPCSGFVASDAERVILSFRGTVNKVDDFDDFVVSLRQWLINFNFAQVSRQGYKVHRGFDGELGDPCKAGHFMTSMT